MVVKSDDPAFGPRALSRRVFWWAIMVSAIAWTLAYKVGKSDPELPEFVYVNF